jgi:hypothetical protein
MQSFWTVRSLTLANLLLFSFSIDVYFYPQSAQAQLPVNLDLKNYQDKSQKQLLCQYIFNGFKHYIKNDLGKKLLQTVTFQKSFDQVIQDRINTHPNTWHILKVNQGNTIPSETNQMGIFNTDDSMGPVMKKTFGFCAGHATLKLQLTQLALYDPQSIFEASPVAAPGSKEWINFYVKKIERISEFHTTIFPGFSSLYELTSHPDLQNYFRAAAADSWVRHAASYSSGVKPFIRQLIGRDFSPKQSVQFIRDVQSRLRLGYSPKIMFHENRNKAVKNEEKSLHVVLALKVYPLKDNKSAILIWDDKNPSPDSMDYLFINHDSGMGFFWSWRWDDSSGTPVAIDAGAGRVNQYRIEASNDQEIARIVHNKTRFCQAHPEVCAQLGNNQPAKVVRPELKIPGKPWDHFEFWDPNSFIDSKYLDEKYQKAAKGLTKQ